MLIKECMSTRVQVVPTTTSLQEAAQIMDDFDCGFLPVSDETNDKLIGVITDRDVVVRAVKKGHELV